MSISEDIYRRSPIWLQGALLDLYALGIARHRYGSPYRRALEAMGERERWPRERLRSYQDERIREVVRAAAGSSFYRARLEAHGSRPDDIRGVDDLAKLPLLTKEEVRSAGLALATRRSPGRGWLHGHTSGTTGSPLGIWYDRGQCIVNNAADARQKTWGGMEAGEWTGLFLGRVIVPTEQIRPPFWRVNHVQRQVWFSSFHLGEDQLPSMIQAMRDRGLRFVEGYPSTLFIVAQHLLRSGDRLPMQAVFSSSETLHPAQREAIEKAFECRLFDFYGHAERAIFGGECSAHQGKHIAEDYGVAEIVDDDGVPVKAGLPGYLVGTSLHNLAMPMIRYRTTDMTHWLEDECACGRTFRRIADVATKAEDIVVTPDGRMVSPSVLTHPFKPFDQILMSQVIQESLNRIRVKIVPSDQFSAEEEATLTEGLRERLGSEMKIEVELVEEIPREASGKFRWVISRVSHNNLVDWIPE